MEIIREIDVFINELFNNINILALIVASLLIVVESMFPILPLAVFITVNIHYFGPVIGFLISWILTCIGCYISFFIFRHKVKFWFDQKFIKNKQGRLNKLMVIINRLEFEKLVLLIAMPFTPAFLINIVAGLSTMKKEKFIAAIIVGKIFLVIFWGFIGTTLIESLKNPVKFIQVGILLGLAYLLSKIVNHKFNIE